MSTRPEVLAVRRGADRVELRLHVPAELAYFPDHFPRFAMLPGVVQLDWAIALAREHLALRGEFRKLLNLKFQHPILPGNEVALTLAQPAQGEIIFAYRCAERTCSGGRIVFAQPANAAGE